MMSRPSGQRRQKYQYSIPMHMVDRLPLIREESPSKLYANKYRRPLDVYPYDYGEKSVRFLPEVTSISPRPSLTTHKPLSPLDIDHTALRWLISDYMAHTRPNNERGGNKVHPYLPDIRHSSTCWCCSGRNLENSTKRNDSYGNLENATNQKDSYRFPTRYEKLLKSQQKGKQRQSDYEMMLLSKRQNPEPITYEETFLPHRDDVYHYGSQQFTPLVDPSDFWATRRRLPGGVRVVPREYLIPGVTSTYDYENLDDYVSRLNRLNYFAPSRNVSDAAPSRDLSDADERYNASMKKLRQQLHYYDTYDRY